MARAPVKKKLKPDKADDRGAHFLRTGRLSDHLVGHQDTMETLFAAQEQKQLASTLLFVGVAGIGKRLAAHALVQALVCEKAGVRACGECGPCIRVAKEQSESVLNIAPDGASIKIEQARQMLEFISLQKLGRARAVIIDQAHLLNPQAGNALLKSLEEPPEGTFFILITPSPAAMLSTIRSRSQLVRFKPLSDEQLAQVIGADTDAWIIQGSHGSVEQAQRLSEKRDEFLKLESAALSFAEKAPHAMPSLEILELRELTKEKAAQIFVVGVLQRVLLDGLRLQSGVAVTSAERPRKISRAASSFQARHLGLLADLSLGLEAELSRNIDRGLLFENLALQWRAAAGGGVA
jgi:DNA polymerase-3 subunit delta'